MRLSTVILPIYRWAAEGERIWRWAEELGFHAGYTYDHLSWRTFRDEPWYAAVPTLTAAAIATSRMRLGTLVASPNFRHPVPLAKELLTLDDVSAGRFTLGIGAGGSGFDATVLGQEEWTPPERADRFADFVTLLDTLLTQSATTMSVGAYEAVEARNIPGCVQKPRLPFHLAARGPRGLKLAAEYGQGWITYADPRTPQAPDPHGVVASQVRGLEAACEAAGRDASELERTVLQGPMGDRPWSSVDQFVDLAGRYADLGITELVVHWPVPNSIFAADAALFERIATDAMSQLGH